MRTAILQVIVKRIIRKNIWSIYCYIRNMKIITIFSLKSKIEEKKMELALNLL